MSSSHSFSISSDPESDEEGNVSHNHKFCSHKIEFDFEARNIEDLDAEESDIEDSQIDMEFSSSSEESIK